MKGTVVRSERTYVNGLEQCQAHWMHSVCLCESMSDPEVTDRNACGATSPRGLGLTWGFAPNSCLRGATAAVLGWGKKVQCCQSLYVFKRRKSKFYVPLNIGNKFLLGTIGESTLELACGWLHFELWPESRLIKQKKLGVSALGTWILDLFLLRYKRWVESRDAGYRYQRTNLWREKSMSKCTNVKCVPLKPHCHVAHCAYVAFKYATTVVVNL